MDVLLKCPSKSLKILHFEEAYFILIRRDLSLPGDNDRGQCKTERSQLADTHPNGATPKQVPHLSVANCAMSSASGRGR